MTNTSHNPPPKTLEWIGDADGFLRLLDQTRLPTETVYRDCRTAEDVWEAIHWLRVRGAPAIGVSAAYGVVLGLQPEKCKTPAAASDQIQHACNYLRSSRPTAVNLAWAVERMLKVATEPNDLSPSDLKAKLLREARTIQEQDRAMCRAIGEVGASLIRENMGVLTHCNAGALAASEYGTALAALFVAKEQGRQFTVYADETRPLLQGARLTTWELHQHGIKTILICDNMAAQVMKEGHVQTVIVGADCIAANGDTANKIGTYGLALLARAHDIPFYVAAPSSTFNLTLPDGRAIPIEQRDPIEITMGFGRQTAPDGIEVYNPAFDVTPAQLITGIVTDRGLIQPVTEDQIANKLNLPV